MSKIHIEGFKDFPNIRDQTELFLFRTGLKLQTLKDSTRSAFVWRDTLYLLPIGQSILTKTIETLTQTQSDWAVLRSLLEMSTPLSLRDKVIRP